MKTIYLDQNKWIDLARATKYPDKYPDYRELLDRIETEVSRGEWVFPLSVIHFTETLLRANIESRLELAKIMAKYSKSYSIKPYFEFEPIEIHNCFANIHDTTKIRSISPISRNFLSAIGIEDIAKELKNELPSEQEDAVQDYLEKEIIRNDELFAKLIEQYDDPSFVQDMHRERLEASRDLEKIKDKIIALPKGHKYNMFLINSFCEVLTPHIATLYTGFKKDRVTLIPDEILSDQTRIRAILESVPSLTVRLNLMYEKYKNPAELIDKNDNNDINFLAAAIPYCDIVVTEKSWRHHAMQSELDSIYSCVIICDIKDLLQY